MTLEPDFQFSASSLQDYVDCPRRFELRYIEHRRWPALESEPVLDHELHMQQGYVFHKLAQQFFLGLGDSIAELSESDGDLKTWWDNFRREPLIDTLPAERYPEHALSARIGDFRLLAKYDLLAVEPGERFVIVDWKTSRGRTRPERIRQRLQTRLYPLVLVQAGNTLNAGQPIQPHQVQMFYWFAAHPERPERIDYSQQQFDTDADYIERLTNEVAARTQGQYPMTENEQHCEFCNYRSLCQRGVEAGDWSRWDDEDVEQDGDIDLDFDQIGEIAF